MNIFNSYIYSANHKWNLWLKWLIYCSWWCTFAASYPIVNLQDFKFIFHLAPQHWQEGSSAKNTSNGQIMGQRLCVFCYEKSGGSSL